MTNTRSPSWLNRFNYHDSRDRALLDSARDRVKNLYGQEFRIKLQGRLGIDNPLAEQYRRTRDWQCIRLKDSGYVDAYVYTREFMPNSTQTIKKIVCDLSLWIDAQ